METKTDNYKAQCEIFIKEWLCKNTFYKANDIILDDFKYCPIELYAKVCNNFNVERIDLKSMAQVDELINKVIKHNKPQFKDEIYYTKQEYVSALEKNIANVNEIGFKGLFERIKDGDWGEFTKEIIFHINETRIIYQYKCPECDGVGELKCSCRNGRVKCSSWNCKNGRIKRTETDGKRKRTYYEDCNNCQGTGWETCTICNGSRIVKCGACVGSGLQYEVAIFACSTKPKYDFIYPENIDKKIFKILKNTNNLPQIAYFLRESITDKNNNAVFEKYKISVPFAAFSIAINGKKYDWVLYGKNIQIFKKNIYSLKKYAIRGCIFVLIIACVIACILWLKYANILKIN